MNAGGAERVAATLCNAWADQGHDVTLMACASQTQHKSFYDLQAQVKLQWLADALPKNRVLSRLLKPYYLRQVVQKIQPEVVISFLTNVNITALLALKSCPRGTGPKLIVCERTNPMAGQNISAVLKWLRRTLYPRADAVMLQTQAAAQQFEAHMPALRKVAVIANPLPAEFMPPEQVEQAEKVEADPTGSNSHEQPKVLLAMGRLNRIKRFDFLLECFAQVRQACPDWQLHIYGQGPEHDTLQQQIDHLQLQDRAFLKGKTDQVRTTMLQAQAFALTSRLEGFPNVLLEAMACGLPAITVDCPSGPAELSQHGQLALLVGMHDKAAFVAQLQKLLSDASLRAELGQKAQSSVLANYSLEAVLEDWRKLFADLELVTSCKKN